MIFLDFSTQNSSLGFQKLKKKSKSCVCGPCQLGKQIKSIHKKVKQIATSKPLELVHMDLIGLTK